MAHLIEFTFCCAFFVVVVMLLTLGISLTALGVFAANRAVWRKVRSQPCVPRPVLRDLLPGDHFITARDAKYQWATSHVFEKIEDAAVRRVCDDFHMLIDLTTPVIKVRA